MQYKKYTGYLSRGTCLALCLLTLLPSALAAADDPPYTSGDVYSITNNTPFYEPTDCGSGNTPPAASSTPASSGTVTGGVPFDDSNSSPHPGQTDIDTDGSGATSTGRGSSDTNLHSGGQAMDGDKVHFYVLQTGWADAHGGIKLGDVAALTYHGRTTYAVFGDNNGTGSQTHSEISVSAAAALGGSGPNSLNGVKTVIYPGTHKLLNVTPDSTTGASTSIPMDQLQAKIDQIGGQVSGGGSATSPPPSTDQSSTNCCTGSGSAANSAPTPAASSGGTISGDIKSLAKQILSNKSITFDYGTTGPTFTQFQRLSNGQKAQTDDGRQVDVEPIILIALLHLAQSHKVQISALTDGASHTAPGNPHGSGKAVDIDFLDGQGTNGSDAIANTIINDVATVLPAGSRFGMGDNPFGSKQIAGKTFTSFTDNPNHVHVDVVGVSQTSLDSAVQAAGGSASAPSATSAASPSSCCPANGSSSPSAPTTGASLVWPFATKNASQYNRVDQGWDIQDQPGAAIYAIAPGTLYTSNPDPIGGFGNDYPTEKLDQSIGGPSMFVYYGHVHIDPSLSGKHVDAGKLIAQANSTDPQNGSKAPPGWLEIGFANSVSGDPVNSGSGPTVAGQKMKDILSKADPAPQSPAASPSSSTASQSSTTAQCCTTQLGGPAGSGPLFELAFPQVSDTVDLAKHLDDYIKRTQPTSPLIGLGADFVAAGQKYNVNPALEVAIAFKESSLGINQVANSHDAWGLTAVGDVKGYPYIGGEYAFPSWKVGINEATKYVGDNYIGPNSPLHSTTIEQFMQHYTPPDYLQQATITLTEMHKMLDGISTQGGSASTSTSDQSSSSGCSTATTTSTGPVNIIKHDVYGNGDGLMGHQPTMIGLHYTEGNPQTVDDVVSMLKDPGGAKGCSHITQSCSVQLTIDPKGNVYQLTSRLDVVTENIINFNNADIGIEIMGSGEQALLSNDAQFNAVVATVVQLMKQYNIKMVQDFSNKSGLMGHIECDTWSDAHVGNKFTGVYSGETVGQTQGHTDPGLNYMDKIRAAVGPALTQ